MFITIFTIARHKLLSCSKYIQWINNLQTYFSKNHFILSSHCKNTKLNKLITYASEFSNRQYKYADKIEQVNFLV